MAERTQALRDEREILNGLGRFARILDGREWDAVGEVFADDVAFDYGLGESVGIDALRSVFRRFLDPCGPSQHLIGSVQLWLDADAATTRAYVQARHQGRGAKADRFLDSNGEYVDQWQRRAEGWRIVRREARWAIQLGDASVFLP